MFVESVFLTGSNRGIGLEFVKQFLDLDRPPKHLIATCRNPDSAQELQELKKKHAGKTNVHILALEATDEKQIAECVEETTKIVGSEGLTLLINNAAILEDSHFPNITSEQLIRHHNVNVVAPLLLTQALVPLLKLSAARNNSGDQLSIEKSAILNMGALIATFKEINMVIPFNIDAYRITKAGFHMVAATQARELRPHNILVLTIHPGWVATDMGGPLAPMGTQDSVRNVMGVLKTVGPDQHGVLLNYDGNTVPW